jgi:hypothetical protein
MAGASSATQRTFEIQGAAGEYIDLAGLLSRTNKRLYRQGMVYHARISVTNGTAAGGANHVRVLHNSWRIRKAWALAKESWMNSTAEERAAGIRAGRWNDFKIFFETAHNAGNTIGPVTTGDGEWNYTQAARADTGGLVDFHMLGATAGTRFGILREYDDMADQQQDVPAAGAATMPYGLLNQDRVAAQAEQIQEEGDLPPYSAVDLEDYVAETNYSLTSPLTPGGNTVISTGMIEIPCGLVKLPATGAGGLFRIDFKAGNYKGVHAEVMA